MPLSEGFFILVTVTTCKKKFWLVGWLLFVSPLLLFQAVLVESHEVNGFHQKWNKPTVNRDLAGNLSGERKEQGRAIHGKSFFLHPCWIF